MEHDAPLPGWRHLRHGDQDPVGLLPTARAAVSCATQDATAAVFIGVAVPSRTAICFVPEHRSTRVAGVQGLEVGRPLRERLVPTNGKRGFIDFALVACSPPPVRRRPRRALDCQRRLAVPAPMTVPALARTAACTALAATALVAGPGPDTLRASLALFVLIGGLWLTQALPLAVTALAVPVLAVAAGLADLRAALTAFAHPTIFLFLGGFALAAALRQQGLDRALAGALLRLAGGRRGRAVVLLAAATALLSMWMSNTATAAMMLPLALGLVGRAPGPAAPAAGPLTPASEPAPAPAPETVFVLLALAYSASLGGMATPIGSPPNALAAAHAGLGFADWVAWGLPIAVLLWSLMMLVLWAVLRPRFDGPVAAADAPGGDGSDPAAAWVWTGPRLWTLAVFAAAVAGWMAGAPLARALGLAADVDAWVALAALLALVLGGGVRWAQVEAQTEWGVLLLFGGGLALSELMQRHGAAAWLAGQALAALQGAPPWLVLAGVVVFVVLMSELLSNTAATALVLPAFVPVAQALGLSPALAAFTVAIAASCGFMLPVATPPNGLVFATGQVPAARMMRCGAWLNLACAAALTAAIALLAG